MTEAEYIFSIDGMKFSDFPRQRIQSIQSTPPPQSTGKSSAESASSSAPSRRSSASQSSKYKDRGPFQSPKEETPNSTPVKSSSAAWDPFADSSNLFPSDPFGSPEVIKTGTGTVKAHSQAPSPTPALAPTRTRDYFEPSETAKTNVLNRTSASFSNQPLGNGFAQVDFLNEDTSSQPSSSGMEFDPFATRSIGALMHFPMSSFTFASQDSPEIYREDSLLRLLWILRTCGRLLRCRPLRVLPLTSSRRRQPPLLFPRTQME